MVVAVGKGIRATAPLGLSGGSVRPELAIKSDSASEASTESRRHLASEGWMACSNLDCYWGMRINECVGLL